MNAALDLSLAARFTQPTGPDAELRAAWGRWLAARDELEALPDDIPDEAEAPVWATINEAERIIEGITATPAELDDLVETVAMLLDCAALPADRAARDRIDAALRQAVERRMDVERTAGQTAIVLPFPALG